VGIVAPGDQERSLAPQAVEAQPVARPQGGLHGLTVGPHQPQPPEDLADERQAFRVARPPQALAQVQGPGGVGGGQGVRLGIEPGRRRGPQMDEDGEDVLGERIALGGLLRDVLEGRQDRGRGGAHDGLQQRQQLLGDQEDLAELRLGAAVSAIDEPRVQQFLEGVGGGAPGLLPGQAGGAEASDAAMSPQPVGGQRAALPSQDGQRLTGACGQGGDDLARPRRGQQRVGQGANVRQVIARGEAGGPGAGNGLT